MRLTSIAILTSLIACSKNQDTENQKPSAGATTKAGDPAAPPSGETTVKKEVVKKTVDKTPLPALEADTGGATGKPLWSIGFGGLGIDSPRDLALAKTGDIYVAGYFDAEMTVGGKTFTPTPPKPNKDPKQKTVATSDAYLVKLSADGKVQWTKTWGAARDEDAKAVAVNGDLVAVAGNFLDELVLEDKSHQAVNSDDIYVAAFTADGKLAWMWTAGGIDSDGANAIAAAPDGGWYVGGSFRKVSSFDQTKTEYKSKGGTDAFLAKLSKTGDLEWVKTFGGAYDDTILHLAVDERGNVYVQGHFKDKSDWGGGELVAGGGSDNDVVLAKYDVNGDHVWSKRFGNAFNDVAGGLAVDRAGNITMVGSFDKSVSFADGDDHRSNGEADIFIARFDPSGKLDWAKTYGSDREDVGWGVAADAAGNTVMTGWFQNTVNFGKTTLGSIKSKGNKDVFAIKHDAKGNVVWLQTWGDKDHDQGRAVALDDKGHAVIAGIYRFALSVTSPAIESVRAPDDRIPKPDTFVVKLDR
ncbi:MAG TPA: hypothetical protein VFQ53_29500 [Kofleriaceae bacterium]|nr:hypothetical protein [Kofleriaceae bacterium]